MPQTGLFYSNFVKGKDLKPGSRGFQAGPISSSERGVTDMEKTLPPLRSGRQKVSRRNW